MCLSPGGVGLRRVFSVQWSCHRCGSLVVTTRVLPIDIVEEDGTGPGVFVNWFHFLHMERVIRFLVTFSSLLCVEIQ